MKETIVPFCKLPDNLISSISETAHDNLRQGSTKTSRKFCFTFLRTTSFIEETVSVHHWLKDPDQPQQFQQKKIIRSKGEELKKQMSAAQ